LSPTIGPGTTRDPGDGPEYQVQKLIRTEPTTEILLDLQKS